MPRAKAMQIYNAFPATAEVRFISPQSFLNTTKSVTQTSRTIIIGFTYKGGNDTTAKGTNHRTYKCKKGSNLRTREKSTM